MNETADQADRAVRPANQRGAARLAAVQALYQMDVGGTEVADVIAEFELHRLGQAVDEPEGDVYRTADTSWFRDVVVGVLSDQRRIDPMVHTALVSDWPLRRIDTTLRAILRAGTYELLRRRDVPAKVVINEYLEITKAFFAEDEPRLVNGVLDRIAHEVRADEFSSAAQHRPGRPA